MDFVDTHCHIQSARSASGERTTAEIWSKNPQLTAANLIAEATAAGVRQLVCVGCDLADSQLAVAFAQSQSKVWASIGIHPHEAKTYAHDALAQAAFINLASQPKIVAIGECGLDYFYNHSSKGDQIAALHLQIQLALKRSLPLIFHVREAFDDFWPIFEQYEGIRGVLHSFTDSQQNLDRAVAHDLLIGVNGIVTFVKQPLQLAVYKAIPLRNLILETDAPFLTPTPYRGTVNEPKHVVQVATFLSRLRSVELTELAAATTTNANKLFSLV